MSFDAKVLMLSNSSFSLSAVLSHNKESSLILGENVQLPSVS